MMLTASTASGPVTRKGTGFWFSMAGIYAVAITAMPFVFMQEEPHCLHLLFHVVGTPVCVLGIWLFAKARAVAPSKSLRVVTWIMTVLLGIWAFRHAGELVALLNGAVNAEPALFENPTHMLFANFAAPGWAACVLLSVVSS